MKGRTSMVVAVVLMIIAACSAVALWMFAVGREGDAQVLATIVAGGVIWLAVVAED